MQAGRGGMGMRKHGKTGWKNGHLKSPKLRLWEKMQAEKNERKPRKVKMYKTVRELMNECG